MLLKQFKALINQAPLLTVYNAPVKYKIENSFVFLEWRGIDSGVRFTGSVNQDNLKDVKFSGDFKDPEIKFSGDNVVAVKLAFLNSKTGSVWYNHGYTPICFWHRVAMPVK